MTEHNEERLIEHLERIAMALYGAFDGELFSVGDLGVTIEDDLDVIKKDLGHISFHLKRIADALEYQNTSEGDDNGEKEETV